MPTLRLLSPASLPRIGNALHFDARIITIGSRAAAGLRIPEPTISPLHARLTQETWGFLLEDLGSENGLYVGYQRVRRCRVGYNQLFRVGRVAVMLVPDVGRPIQPSKLPELRQLRPADGPTVMPGTTPRTAPTNQMAWLASGVAALVTASVYAWIQVQSR